MEPYIAHTREDGAVQTVEAHSRSTAELCRSFAIEPLQSLLYAAGMLHDVGKYQPSFQKRIRGSSLRVQHAICGAQAAHARYSLPVSLILGLCIAGHHGGLPDTGAKTKAQNTDAHTYYAHLASATEDYSAYEQALTLPTLDTRALADFIRADCATAEQLIDKFAFLVRYCYSCLTDADTLDTIRFCGDGSNRALRADFAACLRRVEARLSGFLCTTDLQRARAYVQAQVFEKIRVDAEVYLMNMPTGSGKTLCSLRFALERALLKKKRRIIYIIPYNSIIDQTAQEFTSLLGQDAELLRHQSTFTYESDDEDDWRHAAQFAAENWDAQLIVTTAVQFFESIYSNRKSKLRKLHNLADSILVFDEAHLMPQNFLQPCLEAVQHITRYLNSEALFLTATMPNYQKLLREYGFADCRIVELIGDRKHFPMFAKCRFTNLGTLSDAALLEKAAASASALLVVNGRKTAQALYKLCGGQKYHLSTYMTAHDRTRVIGEIKAALAALEADYPSLAHVPPERRITVVSTSLIEAGVDLDFATVFRELTGLDSILQAGGRCNREGKRQNAETFVFERSDADKRPEKNLGAIIMRSLLNDFDDISTPACIAAYYERLHVMQKEENTKNAMYKWCADLRAIPFRAYAEAFQLIDSRTVSVLVPTGDGSKAMLAAFLRGEPINLRRLQPYGCSIFWYEFEDLKKQGVLAEHNGMCYLQNLDYYDAALGIQFQGKDLYI